jgi:hypothetical protein
MLQLAQDQIKFIRGLSAILKAMGGEVPHAAEKNVKITFEQEFFDLLEAIRKYYETPHEEDYDKLINKPAVDGAALDKDSTAAGLGLAKLTDITDKADKINYPAIPFDGDSLDVSPPYSIHFNTAAHPVITPPAPGTPGLYGWQVYGHPLWFFGFFSEDGVTTKVGLFEVADDEIVEIDSIYDGANWSNGGIWPVRYGVKSYPMSVGILSGIAPAADMTIPALGTKDLVDVANAKQDKILTDLSEKDKVVVAHGDGGIDAVTYELSGDLDNSDRKIPVSRTVYQNILAESVSRQNADIGLGARLDRQQGLGGALSAYDFGTLTPTQEQLIEYYCVGIWGGYDYDAGTFTWNPSEPENSTYEIGGVTHTAGEIFNNTWFRNIYDDSNHRFVITNTPDTSPPVFIVTDVGVDTVAMATGILAGIAKLYNDVENSNTDGGVTQAAVKAALAAEESRASEAESGLAGVKQDKIPAQTGTGGQVLLAPSAAGGTPAQEPLTDFVRTGVGAKAPVQGSSGIIIDQGDNQNSYNEGMRINFAENNYAGIVLGGKPGTVNGMESSGAAADQADPATRRATWFIASNNLGELIISMAAAAAAANAGGLSITRDGVVRVHNNEPALYSSLLYNSRIYINATGLGIPTSNPGQAAALPFYAPANGATMQLFVDPCLRMCWLDGYLAISPQFTGGWNIPQITIPNAYLPLKVNEAPYLMITGTIHNAASPAGKPVKPFSAYLERPAAQDSGATPFILRIAEAGSLGAGAYTECFINAFWYF